MMEIDSPPLATTGTDTEANKAASAATTRVKIHPLAIIGISDHQTRITTGGSPLSSTPSSTTSSSSAPPPIVGLLFGYQNGITISIVESEEIQMNYNHTSTSTKNMNSNSIISPEQKKNIQTKIELHQKVFPTHEVVGWYRVDTDTDTTTGTNDTYDDEVLPVEMDLIMTNGWMKEYNDSPLFVLMDANEKKQNNSAAGAGAGGHREAEAEKDPKKTNKNEQLRHPSYEENAQEKLEREEQLPLAVYETMTTGSGAGTVFVNLELELEYFEPERIAIERVLQTQPKNASASNISTTTSTSTSATANSEDAAFSSTTPTTPAAADSATETNSKSTTTTQTQSSAAGTQIQSLITSIEAMNTRIAVLLDFLHRTQNGEIPPNHALLRQVRSLVNQLPLVMGKGKYGPGGGSGGGTTGTAEDQKEEREEKMRNEILAKEFQNEYDDMLVVSFLATIAKTTKAVLSYSEKFKVVNDSNSNSTSKDSFGKGRGYDH